jgi:hypothetical protein
LKPDAREAVFKSASGYNDCLIGSGAGSESVHHHHAFSKLARHEKILRATHATSGPNA